MSGIFKSLKRNYQSLMERQSNRPFLEGVMAACAMVASADGTVSFAERVRIDQILQSLRRLQVFDPHEGINIFNDFTDQISEHPETGHETAFKAMENIAQDADNRALIFKIFIAICQAESDDNMADQIKIVSLCSRLNINSTHLGLYVDQTTNEIINPNSI